MQLTTGIKQGVLLGATLVALLPQIASAALGGPESALASDAQQLKASIKSTQLADYRVHEIQLPSGTVLREFADAGGRVFAVAWKGPSIPDLRQALGQYFGKYSSTAPGTHSSRNHLEIRQDDLVIQSNGHMGAFTGRAYLPQAMPASVSLSEIH